MDLFNQTLNSFSSQISEGGVSFNLDIFEANLINITLLAGGLFYLLSDVLSESLSERQQKILESIQESEEKLQEATTRLTEVETKLEQAQIVIESIQKDAEQTALQVKTSILAEGKAEIERINANTKAQVQAMDSRILKKLSEFFANVTIQRLLMRIDNNVSPRLHEKIIDTNILNIA